MPRKAPRIQKRFFDAQEELPGAAPARRAKGRRKVIALDWFDQTLRGALGSDPVPDSALVMPDRLSPSEVERLESYEVLATKEGRAHEQIERLCAGRETVSRLLAIYYALVRPPRTEPCLVISVGAARADGGLVSAGRLERSQSRSDLSLRGLWLKHLEGNGPLRRLVGFLRAEDPAADGEVFAGFTSALRDGAVFEMSRIRIRPPVDIRHAVPLIRDFCRQLDPGGEAKTLVISDWAAAHCNLADLLRPHYPTLLCPPPAAAFDQAAVGLLVYSLESEKRRERESRQKLAAVINDFDDLSGRHDLIRVAALTKELAEGLKNISPATAVPDPQLAPYLLLAGRAAGTEDRLLRAADATDATGDDELKSLAAEVDALRRSVEALSGSVRPAHFTAVIEAAGRHLSLRPQSARLMELLDLEELDIPAGRAVGQRELAGQFEVISEEGAGDRLVVESVVEKGYRLKSSGEIVKRPKVRMRRELSRRAGATTAAGPGVKKGAASAAGAAAATPASPASSASSASSASPASSASSASSASRRAAVGAEQTVVGTGATAGPSSTSAFGVAAWVAAAILAVTIATTFIFFAVRGGESGVDANANAQASATSDPAGGPGSPSPESPAGQGTPEQSAAATPTTTPPSADANVNANAEAEEDQSPGVLSVAANLSGVQVRLGDDSLFLSGAFQPRSLNLSPGRYVVRATKPGYSDWADVVDVRPGERTVVRISFDESQRTDRQFGAASAAPTAQPPSPRDLAAQHLSRGTLLSQQRDHRGALAEALAGLRLDPANVSLARLKEFSENAMRPISTPSATPAARVVIEPRRVELRPESPPPTPSPVERRPAPAAGRFERAVPIKSYNPHYPLAAKTSGVRGSVKVEVSVDERGEVTSARAVSGHPLLKQAANDAARRWKFRPARRDGQPVPDQTTLTFNFGVTGQDD